MLKFIRESMQGLIAWAIIILLIVPFALWGINQYFSGAGPLAAATVNGKEISVKSFQQAYTQQRNQMRKMLGAQYDPSMFDDRIKKQAIDGLVDREVLFQNAKDMGLRIASESVISTVQGFKEFQQDGKFSNELYTRILGSQGETATAFENRIQQSILTQQLYTAVNNSAIVTKKEVNNIVRLQQQQRDFSYITLAVAKYKDESTVKEDAIKKYYGEHQNDYMTPEKVSIEYVELDAANLAQDKNPTDAELKQLYEDRKGQMSSPEERRTRHILIAVPEGADAKAVAAARKKAEDLRKRILAGESFEKLAKKYSDDPGSSKLGGDIGYFGHGSLDPAYEKAMFSLKKGEVSEPVLSSFGFHIIKLEDVHPAKIKSFEQVKDQLIKEYRKGIAEREFYKKSEKLTNLAYEVPDTLSDAANAVGLEIKATELFDRKGGKGIAANPKVIAAAFSDDVIKQGYNSEPIEIGENHVIVLRMKDHVDRKQQALAEVKDQIKAKLVNEAARENARAAGEKIIAQLQSGTAPAETAKTLGEQWKEAKGLKRDDHTVSATILKTAFSLAHPATGTSVFGGTALASGDFVVIDLTKVVDGDADKTEAAKRLTLKRNLVGQQGEADFNDVLASLKKKAKIEIEQDKL